MSPHTSDLNSNLLQSAWWVFRLGFYLSHRTGANHKVPKLGFPFRLLFCGNTVMFEVKNKNLAVTPKCIHFKVLPHST